MTVEMKTKSLAHWFGSNRMLAPTVGKFLGRCDWIGVPFCGGCCELPYLECRAGVANDKHRHIINLARVIRDPHMKADLVKRLEAMLFHPDELAKAQSRCAMLEADFEEKGVLFGVAKPPWVPTNLQWAQDYFVTVWMARGGTSGTHGEFSGSLPTRWNANGGGSNVRYRSAVESLNAWHEVCKGWEFECLDAFEFIDRIKDVSGLGVYVDAPWPDAGDGYRHRFTRRDQEQLAMVLAAYKLTRVVIRFGDHQLIRELYPEAKWKWLRQTSRDQANQGVQEVLISNTAGE